MKTLKLLATLVLLEIMHLNVARAQMPASPLAETSEQKAERMQWWTEARFGMFLHWGLYSVTAGDWKGRPTKGGEHFMLYERIPVKEYAQIAKDFNPVKFNADQWVKLGKEAGMKYIVITSKHHDGFAMYESPSSDYNIVKRTPYKKDPLKALAAACQKYGLKLCFYYSLGRDWEDPDVPTNWPVKAGRSNTWDYPDEDAKVLSRYFERKVKPQIKELLTQYGPVGVLWFDTPEMITRQQSIELKNMIRELQPDCIINSRIGNGQGDFLVSEQAISKSSDSRPWESCVTMSENWGYNRHDTAWKSPELLVRQLVETVSKGGNYLLNIGPTGEGALPPESIERLKALAGWMKLNNEAIYGTRPWKIHSENYSTDADAAEDTGSAKNTAMKDAVNDATSKKITPEIRYIAKGDDLFIVACSWSDAQLKVKSLGGKEGYRIASVELLGSDERVEWKQNNELLDIRLPSKKVNDIPVYVFKLTGPNLNQ